MFNHLPVEPLRVTSKFGPRNTGIKNATTYHHGVDLGRDFSKAETIIMAVAKGTIKYNGWHKYRGWYVVIQHEDFQTLYQHLKYKCTLPIGTIVPSGAAIGLMGNSSDTSVLKVPIHLHFAVCKDFSKPTENGRGYVDPLPYLKNIKEDEDLTDAQVREIVKEMLNGKGNTPSTWAKESWEKAKKDGITDGSEPKGYPTKEEVVIMLERAIKG